MLTDRKALGFKDVMIVPSASDIKSRKEVSLERTFKFRNSQELTCVPIIASNMASIGTWEVASVLSKHKILTCLHKKTEFISFYDHKELLPYVAATVGLDELRIQPFPRDLPVNILCLDVANGYIDRFVKYTAFVKERHPNKIIMAGNVATYAGASDLWNAGADIVKVGIGSGSVCTTRYKTGVGVPQVSAVAECRSLLPQWYTCSDGGCTNPGDVAKAFVAGADFVMLGGMFAGTKETGMMYRGEAYCEKESDYKTSEGKQVYAGSGRSLDTTIKNILGGLRSTGSYIGYKNIEDFYKADLIQVNEQTNNFFGEPS